MGGDVDGVLVTSSDDIDQRIRRMIAVNEPATSSRTAACHPSSGIPGRSHPPVRRANMLSLPILSIGGRDAAYILGVVERGSFYDVTLVYDESFRFARPRGIPHAAHAASPGRCRRAPVISHGAHDYKRHWATTFVPQRRMFLFSPRPFAAAARLVRFHLQPLWQQTVGSRQ